MNTDPDDENRSGPRFWFPTYDLWAVFLGLYAFASGSPLLNRLFPDWFTNVMSAVITLGAVMALVGVCIPRLALIELAGKLILVFLLGAYAGTVAFMTQGDNPPDGFLVIVIIMAVWLLGPRVTVLFVQIPKAARRRRDARKPLVRRR